MPNLRYRFSPLFCEVYVHLPFLSSKIDDLSSFQPLLSIFKSNSRRHREKDKTHRSLETKIVFSDRHLFLRGKHLTPCLLLPSLLPGSLPPPHLPGLHQLFMLLQPSFDPDHYTPGYSPTCYTGSGRFKGCVACTSVSEGGHVACFVFVFVFISLL